MYVKRRLDMHKNHYKRYLDEVPGYFKCSSYEILKGGDYIISTIDIYPCKTKKELEIREQEHIDANDCVNQYRAHRTPIEKAKYNKQYLRNRAQYQNSWGGRIERVNNSLLKIDPTLFS